RGEASARLKIAQAEVKERQAEAKAAKPEQAAIAEARLEAARARAELAQIELDRCTLRAPFAGRILAAPASPGQFLTKGSPVAELADVSTLRALVPVDRAAAPVGSEVVLSIEGRQVPGKVTALLPLPESLAALRELASPLAAAWVQVGNAKGELEPGHRVLSPFVPHGPI